MSEPENTRVEHHWHEPSNGQVVKAMRQYLTENVGEAKLNEMLAKKVDEVVLARVEATMNSPNFQKALLDAVVQAVAKEKKIIVEDRYCGTERRLSRMVTEELSRMLTSEYTVEVKKK